MTANPRRAFTVLEMTVALAITLTLVVIMLQIFISGTTLWKQNDERLDTFREARAALQIMARDLGSISPAGPPINPAPALPDQFPLLALQYHTSTGADDKVNQEVYGLASISNSGKSDLCAVGYFCEWNVTKNTFVLKRQFSDSNTTFTNLKQALPVASPMTGQQAFNVLFARPSDAPSALKTSAQSIDDMASFVWDLEFVTPTTDNPPKLVAWPQGYFWKELPLWIEVHFKALGSTAARKLEGQPITRKTWFVTNSTDPSQATDYKLYQHMILPGSQQFVTRVKLCR